MLKKIFFIILFVILFISLCILSLFVGVSEIHFTELFYNHNQQNIFFYSRVPRLISIVISGSSISICGLILQYLTRNKFVSPTTIGLNACSSLGIILSLIFLSSPTSFLQLTFATGITLTGAIIFMMILFNLKHRNDIFIPLIGMIFNGVITSLTIFIALKFDVLQSLSSWTQGDFSTIISGRYELLYISIPALIIIYFFCNRFIIASFGEDLATNLGLNYRNTLFIGLLLVSIIVGIVNVNIGSIPFLGLIVPNLISLYLGDNIKKVLFYNTIVGAFFILICDILGRLIIYPYEIPVSMITGIIGSLLFLFLVIRKKQT